MGKTIFEMYDGILAELAWEMGSASLSELEGQWYVAFSDPNIPILQLGSGSEVQGMSPAAFTYAVGRHVGQSQPRPIESSVTFS